MEPDNQSRNRDSSVFYIIAAIIVLAFVFVFGAIMPGPEFSRSTELVWESYPIPHHQVVTGSSGLAVVNPTGGTTPEQTTAVNNANRGGNIEWFVSIAWNDLWQLNQGSPGPTSYDDLLSTGTLAIILTNPYTDDDIVSTPDYSPGNFYISFPTIADPVYEFRQYVAPDHWAWDEQLFASGEIKPLSTHDPVEYTMDGHTLSTKISYEDMIDSLDQVESPAAMRERYYIPADDNARVKMLIVADYMQEVLGISYEISLNDNPASLDEIISVIGRKNPVAWTNPYTGEPIQEVPWVNVYQVTTDDQQSGHVQDASPWPQSGINNKDELVGNYSFVYDQPRHSPYYPREQGFRVACVQFYFRLPNGDVAAYQATGEWIRP